MRSSLVRRTRLVAASGILLWLSGCGTETVQLKGGTEVPATSEKVSAKMKAARQAEEVIFQKSKKLR